MVGAIQGTSGRCAKTGFALATCAGRDPHPVAVVQPQDAQSDCAMLRAEIEVHNVEAENLAEENHAKIAQNVAAGVVGVVVWPVWFAMDAKGAAGCGDGRAQGAPAISRRAGRTAMSAFAWSISPYQPHRK
jgi:hypothetical protein